MNNLNMNIGTNSSNIRSNSIFVGKLPIMQNTTLKSTQEKIERQQKTNNKIEFWENQKESLKNLKCDTIEDIVKKLDKFNTYQDEIAATKMAYNNEQMWHVMDEAKEQGEKIAQEVEKMEPKTPKERREDIVEEALETNENEGILDEITEEMNEIIEEMQEQLPDKAIEEVEEMQEQLEDQTTEKIEETQEQLKNQSTEKVEETQEQLKNVSKEDLINQNLENNVKKQDFSAYSPYDLTKEIDLKNSYKSLDVRI